MTLYLLCLVYGLSQGAGLTTNRGASHLRPSLEWQHQCAAERAHAFPVVQPGLWHLAADRGYEREPSRASAGAGGISNSSNYTFNGSIRLFNPGGSVYKSVSGQVMSFDTSGGSVRLGTQIQGAYEVTTAVNAFQFLMSSGNIASGKIRVYGVAK